MVFWEWNKRKTSKIRILKMHQIQFPRILCSILWPSTHTVVPPLRTGIHHIIYRHIYISRTVFGHVRDMTVLGHGREDTGKITKSRARRKQSKNSENGKMATIVWPRSDHRLSIRRVGYPYGGQPCPLFTSPLHTSSCG